MSLCGECISAQGCVGTCAALEELQRIQEAQDNKDKLALVRRLARRLGIQNAERSEDMRRLAARIIRRYPELFGHIRAGGIRVGYVVSYEHKGGERPRYGDCRKLGKVMQAYLPYDFVITFYDCNARLLNEKQLKILMLHELLHVGMGPKGPKIVRHDIEDFKAILEVYGIEWSTLDNRGVPDILAGLDGETREEGEEF